MKRKIMTAIVAIVLVVSLVSCDAVVNIMGKMGTNIAGADKKQVEAAVESAKVAEEDKTKKETVTTTAGSQDKLEIGKTEVSTKSTFTYGDEDKELYAVGKASDDSKPVVGIGSDSVKLKNLDTKTEEALEKVETVLPPQDITAVTAALDGGSKNETIEKLSEPIEDATTKAAATGTKVIVAALLEEASKTELAPPAAGETEDETKTKAREVVNTILSNLEKKNDDGSEKELTMGDLVVLQTITNVISETSDSILSVINGDSETGDATTEMLDKANDTLVQAAHILNNVSSSTTMFEGVDLETLLSMVLK